MSIIKEKEEFYYFSSSNIKKVMASLEMLLEDTSKNLYLTREKFFRAGIDYCIKRIQDLKKILFEVHNIKNENPTFENSKISYEIKSDYFWTFLTLEKIYEKNKKTLNFKHKYSISSQGLLPSIKKRFEDGELLHK